MAEMIETGADRAALEKALQALILKETGVSVDYHLFASDDPTRSNPRCFGWIPDDKADITDKQAEALDELIGDISLFDDVESSVLFLVSRQLGIPWGMLGQYLVTEAETGLRVLPDDKLWIEINPDTDWVTIYVDRALLEIAVLELWAASRLRGA